MITTSAPQPRSRVFEIALVLSILVHLLGLLVYWGAFARLAPLLRPIPKDEEVATSDVIRIERRTVPRPEVKSPPVALRPAEPVKPEPPPIPEPVKRPVEAPQPRVRHEIARTVPHADAEPKPLATTPSVQPPKQLALAPAAPQTNNTDTYAQVQRAAQQLQQEQRYMAAIKQGISDANAPQHTSPSSIDRPHQLQLGRLSFKDLERSYGLVDFIYDKGRDGNFNWYLIRARVTYPDGNTELVDIPWRLYFPVGNDPIARHDTRYFEVPPPQPGFVLPHPFAPSELVCGYLPAECAALDAAEKRAGGPAGGN